MIAATAFWIAAGLGALAGMAFLVVYQHPVGARSASYLAWWLAGVVLAALALVALFVGVLFWLVDGAPWE